MGPTIHAAVCYSIKRMSDLDVMPVTVRGPHATTSSHMVTFARVIIRDGRLFVAEGRQRGAKVTKVTEYPAPEGEWQRDPRKNKGGTWGPWSWDSCGCGNSWNRHKADDLITMALDTSGLDQSDSTGLAESDALPETPIEGGGSEADSAGSPDLQPIEG